MAKADVQKVKEDWYSIGHKNPDGPRQFPDVRADPRFGELRDQIEKATALVKADKPVDWKRFVLVCRDLLTQSPDIQLAVYLCYGQLHSERYRGLLGGLSCLSGVLDYTRTKTLTAKEDRRQEGAIQWLSESLRRMCAQLPASQDDAIYLAECIEVANDLVRRAGASVRFLEAGNWAPVADSGSPMDEPSLTAEVAIADKAEQAPKVVVPDSDPKTAWKVLSEEAARVFLENRAATWTYKVARMAVWIAIEDYPDHVHKKTRIPRPANDRLSRLAKLEERAEWEALLNDAESLFPEHPLWFDLQRFSYVSLRELGPESWPAAESIRGETAELLARFPDLLEFSFSDGTALASGVTKNWLSEKGLANENGVKAAIEWPGSEQLAASTAALGQSAFMTAVQEFPKLLRGVASDRDRFLLRLEFAKICGKSGHRDLSMAQYRILDADARDHHLAEWEPKLCEMYLAEWLRELSAPRGSGDPNTEFNRAFTALARINSGLALSLFKSR